MNNYFIIHGSFGTPHSNWFNWLAKFLIEKNNSVYTPDFPIGIDLQNYDNWSNLMDVYYKMGLINSDTTIIAHSIAPVFICKYLIEHKITVNKLIFVCGFNNYFGINYEYDTVNKTMYTDNLELIKHYCDSIICFYSDNDPYVKFDAEKNFADQIATKQIVLHGAGHINSETGYTEFKEILEYI